MQLSQGNMLASLENSRTFLRENAADIGDVVTEGTQKRLDDSIADLSVHAATQNSHTRAAAGALNRQRQKRVELLRDHMAPIAKIARLELPNLPEFIALTMPRKRVSLQQLVALADGMADAAAPYADVFIAAGREPDFIDQLKNAAAEMRSASYDRTQNRVKVKEATTNLRGKLSCGRKVIHMLDAFMQSALAGKPGLLEGWNMAKRVPKTGNGAKATTPATPAATAAAA